jgi:hypothetical protein
VLQRTTTEAMSAPFVCLRAITGRERAFYEKTGARLLNRRTVD